MKKSLFLTLGTVILAGSATLAMGGEWTGWISEAHCGVKGANAGHRDCGIKCMKEGQKAVFVDDATQKVFTIDDHHQKIAERMMADHVKVEGEVSGENIEIKKMTKVHAAM